MKIPKTKHVCWGQKETVLAQTKVLDGSVVKNPPANAGYSGLIPGSRKSTEEGNGNPLQSSCLANLLDRGAEWATVHRVVKEFDTS